MYIFEDFIEKAAQQGGFHNDDIVAVVMPLFEEVLSFHEAGKVGPLKGLVNILITNDKLDIDENFILDPSTNYNELNKIGAIQKTGIDLVQGAQQTSGIGTPLVHHTDFPIEVNLENPITKPVYLIGYNCYEHKIGHHDELTDIFSLGLILASISLGLNFNRSDDLQEFVDKRNALLYINDKLHPAIGNLIVEMTELHRNKRAQDLYQVIERLKNFRDYNPENTYDLSVVHGFLKQDNTTKQKWILNKLKSRLFDTSRRNKLLYFKPNLKFVNLTVASFPQVLYINNIDPASLLVWNDDLGKQLASQKEIALSKYLRFEDNPYLPGYLDKLKAEHERDKREYGFSQLKLVACFLNWCHYKENDDERLQTPLVLIPVSLSKRKGLKDQYLIKAIDSEAEVNPILVHIFREQYGIKLPEKINLSEASISTLYAEIVKQIDANMSGIKLELVDKPRIKIIHLLAKQTLNQYNRRILNRGRQLGHYRNFDYSYNHDNYHPLGLQIFNSKVKPSQSYVEWLVSDEMKPAPAPASLMDDSVKERDVYSVEGDKEKDFSWEFDLCNVVLGNFNYKKMSLVSDYNAIIDDNLPGKVFDDIFSAEPKKLVTESTTPTIKEQFPVVVADPTQSAAVQFSGKGESYIIQGPPGTGKSQTITNLIAHYIAAGKKVLFVCEKRAALDVVYFRLKQQGLHELCCLIHDSKEDKKQLIQELKVTYEKYSKQPSSLAQVTAEREDIVTRFSAKVDLLNQFETVFNNKSDKLGMSVRKLVERLIELETNIDKEYKANPLTMPNYAEWATYGRLVEKLNSAIANSGTKSWAAHVGSSLSKEVYKKDEPVSYMSQLATDINKYNADIHTILSKNSVPAEVDTNLDRLKEFAASAAVIKPLANSGNIGLLDKNSPRYLEFKKMLSQYKQLTEEYAEQIKTNANWLKKIDEKELPVAQQVVDKWEGKFFSFLSGEFRRIKKILKESYNFSNHGIKPSLKNIITELDKEYKSAKGLKSFEGQVRETFNIDDFSVTESIVKKNESEPIKYLDFYLNPINTQGNLINNYATLNDMVSKTTELLARLFGFGNTFNSLPDINAKLKQINSSLAELTLASSILKDLSTASDSFLQTLNTTKLDTNGLEAHIAYNNLVDIYYNNKNITHINSDVLHIIVDEVKYLYKEWLRLNAAYILAVQHDKFNKLIKLSEISVTGLSPVERETKRMVTEGRKVLENEFSKQMRYKPIRELATGSTGSILKTLKPVWLMSPLSVSDALPIDSTFFDVVIFDEASQITLEEGIPTIYRASQSIVVGDEMQMPPTNFFGAATQDPDDVFEEEETVAVSLDADSLLTQSARKLPSVMLGWHYRSRFESLISYSNNAFYNAGLLTIPDNTAISSDRADIVVNNAGEGAANTNYLHDRSISYHYLQNGLYEQRTNVSEAEYIANIVLTHIKNDGKESIGIVAFSQEQQGKIEDAIEALATQWNMVTKLEEAYDRTEDDQFVGLFIKNLENVQGDERDIIIMSVCYGYDSNKRMIMNFGPINKKGGERRLNVIFSRAKRHMAIVASIKYNDITNEYNEGANYLRRFLQYAECVSKGKLADASVLLQSLTKEKETVEETTKNSIVDSIAQWLQSEGFTTGKYLGQSYFKCHIGVKSKPDNKKYDLGILIDTNSYGSFNVVEQYYLQPQIMQSFGWNVVSILSKDWLDNKELVKNKILQMLRAQ